MYDLIPNGYSNAASIAPRANTAAHGARLQLNARSDFHHEADCEALTEMRPQSCHSVRLDRREGDPALHHSPIKAALRDISAMQDHFKMLGRISAVEKVVSFLSVLSERVGVAILGAPHVSQRSTSWLSEKTARDYN
jgi:hypothetical protein